MSKAAAGRRNKIGVFDVVNTIVMLFLISVLSHCLRVF